MDRGAKPDVKSKFGNDAIDYAKMNHHLKVAQLMQEKGPKTHALVNSGSLCRLESWIMIAALFASIYFVNV